jgi:hypothetical protein
MLLGKNITLFGVNDNSISCIGQLENWMDLATDCKDKAYKLREWIEKSRHQIPASVLAILKIINDDYWTLSFLQIQVMGISCARMDIITGGSSWWHENYKGVSNVFSAAAITARKSYERADVFRGLLGVFSGLFTPEETLEKLVGDDMERISFEFFKQLSIKTGHAWTKLAVSSKMRKEWDWIPAVANSSRQLMTTDCFSGVVRLGKLGEHDEAKTTASTGITRRSPQRYMTVQLDTEDLSNSEFSFVFHGCNCGKESKRWFSRTSEEIPEKETQRKSVAGDETGRVLLQCATILGSLMDPGNDVVEYRKRLLEKLRPYWKVSDPSAKTADWIDRCVSGTDWEKPDPCLFKVHNRSMSYEMGAIYACGSRLQNESTANISCTVVVNCGCKIVAPFSLIFSAITAVEGSSLGGNSASLEEDTGRITLSDGLGLVQVGDIDNLFSLVAFEGNVESYSVHAKDCRTTKLNKPVDHNRDWPKSRALLRHEVHEGLSRLPDKISPQDIYEGLTKLPGKVHMHDIHEGFTNLPGKMHMHDIQEGLSTIPGIIRTYGYVKTEGSGNLLICRKGFDPYKIIGACIDESMACLSREHRVTIR